MTETGHISINTENILPIIKRWLYAEKEIFLRELVANACDAIHKRAKLTLLGEIEKHSNEDKITIEIDKEQKLLKISDTGVGMTADEVKRYITQVAFSGLTDFVEKYKGKTDEEQIIGHFGLGFYSSFMVADKVEIDTLSCQPGAQAAHWSCAGDTEYTLTPSDRKAVGTTITLHISEAEREILDLMTLIDIANKYCAFIKYPLYLNGEQVNDPRPVWTRSTTELKDEDYKNFYRRLFPMNAEPLFWIHLNVDYPFNLRGVLFFPRLGHELEASQGEVRLFCNQVFVESNCKELIPEYLTLLKGVIDCPDLPLNVSRSALQKDAKVKKIAQHITKKVADKLSGMFKTDRENYQKFWDDINPFVKYGMMRDEDFFERMKDFLLLKTSQGVYLTPSEYLDKYKDLTEGKVLYTTDAASQVGYLHLLKQNNLDAVLAESMLDKHFMPYYEMRTQGKVKFQRVDADVSKHLIENEVKSTIVDPSDGKTNEQKLAELFKIHLKNDKIEVRVESLKGSTVPGLLLQSEQSRRLQEMARFGQFADFAPKETDLKATLIINQNSPAVKNLINLSSSFNREEDVKLAVNYIYDLATMQQGQLSADAMQSFIERSANLLAKLGASSIAASHGT